MKQRQRRRCHAFVTALFVVGASSAWTPHHIRRSAAAGVQSTTKPIERIDFQPMQWAATGIMAASLAFIAFTPLPSNAADTDVRVNIDSNSQVEVKVKMDTTEFLRSIQDNKGDINGAISSIVKNAPSDVVKLDINSNGAAASKKEAPPVVKTEPPKAVESKPVEVNPVESKPVDFKPAESKPVEPKPVEAVAKPAETVGTAPAPKAVVEEKKVDTPKPVEVKQSVETAPSPAMPPEVKKVEEPKPAAPVPPAPVPPVVNKDEPKTPEVRKEAPKPAASAAVVKKEVAKPSVPKAKPRVSKKPEETIVYRVAVVFRDLFVDLRYALLSGFQETKEQAKKQNFDDVSFWERPAFRPSIAASDGKKKVRLYFSTGDVAGVTVAGVAAASLAKYKYDNRQRSERMGKNRNVYDPRNDIRKGIAPGSYNSGEPERYANDERVRYSSGQRVRYNSGTTMNNNDYNFGRDNSRPAPEYKVPNGNFDQNYSVGRQQTRPDNERRRDIFADTQGGGDNPWKVSSSPSAGSNEDYSWTERRESPRSGNMSPTNDAVSRNERRQERNTYSVPWKDSTGSSSTDRPIVERYSGVGRREAPRGDVRPTNTRRRTSSDRSRVQRDAYNDQNPYKTPNSPEPQSNLYDSFNEPRRPYNSGGRSESNRRPANDYRRPGMNGDDDFDDGENPWRLRKQGPR